VNVLEWMDETGDRSIDWDPDDSEGVEIARVQFEALRQAGYLLFTVTEAAEFDPAAGKLVVRVASAPDVEPATSPEPDEPVDLGRQVEAKPRRGRVKSGVQATGFDPKAKRTVAARRMRGG
jgi:hypothetical protein